MPLTATLEDIKAHQEKIEKNKITADNLPPCSRCFVESVFFKIHAYRERRFHPILEGKLPYTFDRSGHTVVNILNG